MLKNICKLCYMFTCVACVKGSTDKLVMILEYFVLVRSSSVLLRGVEK